MIVETYAVDPIDGRLVYREDEYSFDFLVSPRQPLGRPGGIITIGTLQLAIDVDSGRAVYAFGVNPRLRWERRPLVAPRSRAAGVRFVTTGDEAPFEPGIGVRYPGALEWRTWYDESSGWVCIGSSCAANVGMEIAQGVVLCVSEGKLTEVWLKPELI